MDPRLPFKGIMSENRPRTRKIGVYDRPRLAGVNRVKWIVMAVGILISLILIYRMFF